MGSRFGHISDFGTRGHVQSDSYNCVILVWRCESLSIYYSDNLVPTTALFNYLMVLTNLTKRRFAHCGRKRHV